MMRLLITLVLLTGVSFVCSGCSNTIHGMGQDTEETGDYIQGDSSAYDKGDRQY